MPFEDLIRRITGKSSQESEPVIQSKSESKPVISNEKPRPAFLQVKDIEKMSQEEVDKFAAKDFHNLIVTMYPDDFLFLLEKTSIDVWKNIFKFLSEKDISLMNDKVTGNISWKDRLAVLIDKTKNKDKFATQELTLEYGQMTKKEIKELVTKIKQEYGYSVNSKLEGRKETVYDLQEFEKIIKEVREKVKSLIKSGETFPGSGAINIKDFSINDGGYEISLVNSPEKTWGIGDAYEILSVTEKIGKYLQNKPANRSKRAITRPMKKIQPK